MSWERLTAEQELNLIKAWKTNRDDKSVQRQLVTAYERMIWDIAKRYATGCRSHKADDLFQEGFIGFLVALDKFNLDSGNRLSTYATHWIKQAIFRAISNKDRMIRLPNHVHEINYKVMKLVDNYVQKYDHWPTIDDMVNEYGLEHKLVSEVLGRTEPDSLDEIIEGETTYGRRADFIVVNDRSVDETVIGIIAQEDAVNMLSVLHPIEQQVIIKRFGLRGEPPLSLNEVGRLLNRSREGVRRIEDISIKKLRTHKIRT